MEILYKEEQGYVGLYEEPLLGYVMTVELHQWSVSEFKRYLPIWGSILNGLKDRGIKEVFGLCEDAKKAKFNEVFGFIFTGKELICEDGINRYIMRLALC